MASAKRVSARAQARQQAWPEAAAKEWILQQIKLSQNGYIDTSSRKLSAVFGWAKSKTHTMLQKYHAVGVWTASPLPKNRGTRLRAGSALKTPESAPESRPELSLVGFLGTPSVAQKNGETMPVSARDDVLAGMTPEQMYRVICDGLDCGGAELDILAHIEDALNEEALW